MPRVNNEWSSDVSNLEIPNKANIKKWAKNGCKPHVSKNPKIPIADFGASASGLIDMIDTFDRPGDAAAEDTYARARTYAYGGTNKPYERIPKVGAYAEAGVGEAWAEYSVFSASARGPNASAGAEAALTGVYAMASAGIGVAKAAAGPVGVQVGLQLDTGIKAGLDGLEAKVLGIGFSLGPKTSISFLGNELSIDFI